MGINNKKIISFARYLTALMLLSVNSAVLAVAESSQVSRSLPQSTSEQVIKMVLGLIFVLFLIFFVAWLAKNYLGFNPSQNAALRPIAGLTVGQKERVVLIQVADRQILVGVAPGRVNMLHVLDKGSEVVPEEGQKNVFSEKLQMTLKKFDRHE